MARPKIKQIGNAPIANGSHAKPHNARRKRTACPPCRHSKKRCMHETNSSIINKSADQAMPSRKSTPSKARSDIRVEDASGMKVEASAFPMSYNHSFYYVDLSEKSICANITLRLKKAPKATRFTSETMPLDTSNNDSDEEHQSQEGVNQRVPAISRTPSASQSTPTRSSARIAALHRDMSTPAEDPTSSGTLQARKICPGFEHSVFERAFAAIKESEEITKSLEGRIRERLQIIQQWEATLKRREEDEEEEQRKKKKVKRNN